MFHSDWSQKLLRIMFHFFNKRTHLIKLTKVDWPFYSIEVTIEQANAKLIEKGEHLCNAINHFRTYFIFTLR